MLTHHPSKPCRPPAPLQRGITLLESLLSIVILAIAVLGMLGVQVRSLAETQTGVRRAQAVRLIEDLAERIKSNPEAFALLSTFVGDFDASGASASRQCDRAACSAMELAQWDVVKWRAAVADTLPLGKAAVFAPPQGADAGASRHLGVVLAWRANEYARQGQAAQETEAYREPFGIDTRSANVQCPADLICHVAYVQP